MNLNFEEQYFLNEKLKEEKYISKEELLYELKNLKTNNETEDFLKKLIYKLEYVNIREYIEMIEEIPFDLPFE